MVSTALPNACGLQVNFGVEDYLIGKEEGEEQGEGPAMPATTSKRMGTVLRLDSPDYLTASSPNHVDGAWQVGGTTVC
ncbi:unnamed protein product [Taenia asiatica]|uniref:Uncharacterized protein n=1 Tax=Taenia asiatica TaxID=60517 RepID=A0A0R3WH89_TAEAS|nr:unnamed protein product [Taenia asiatica]